MRRAFELTAVFALAVLVSGCPKPGGKPAGVQTNDAFTGRVVFKGEPVSFPEDQDVTMKTITHNDGKAYNIPLKPDGSFEIGWMPVGKCSIVLIRKKKGKIGATIPNFYTPPDFEIAAGVTNYDIELGPDFKPLE